MVFESISTSLSNLGKGTVKTGKSVLSTTKKASKIATDPLAGVAKRTVKIMPFIGTDDDIWKVTHDRYALSLFRTDLQKALKKTVIELKKSKLPPTKMKLLQSAFQVIVHSLDHEIHLEAGTSGVLDMLSSLVKASKTSIPTGREEGKRVSQKKTTLTATQYKALQGQEEALQEKINTSLTSLKDLPNFITTKPSSHYQSKNALKDRRDKNHNFVDDLITTKFDIVTHQKKLYYLLLELERKIKKATAHKNSLSAAHIQSLIKVKIPAQISIIKNLRTSVTDIQTKQTAGTDGFLTGVTSWLDDVAARLDVNKAETQKTLKKTKSKVKKDEKALVLARKKYKKASSSIVSSTKSPYNAPAALQKHILAENKAYQLLEEKVIDRLSLDYSLYLCETRDNNLKHFLVQEHIHRGYDGIMVEKELSLQLGLLNRIHKKQNSAQAKIDTQLKKLKTISGVPSLKNVLDRNTSELKNIKKNMSNVEKQRKSYTDSIDSKKKAIKDQRNLLIVISHMQTKIDAIYEHDIKRSMLSYLTKDTSQLESNITSQQKLLEQVSNTLKKSEIQLKENERSVFTLQDKKRTTKAKDFEKVVHAQEVTLDTLDHHIDYEKDTLQGTNDHIKEYTKDTKKLIQISKKEDKTIKQKKKSLKRNALTKKVTS